MDPQQKWTLQLTYTCKLRWTDTQIKATTKLGFCGMYAGAGNIDHAEVVEVMSTGRSFRLCSYKQRVKLDCRSHFPCTSFQRTIDDHCHGMHVVTRCVKPGCK